MNIRDTATRLSYALDLPEEDMYAILTATGVAPVTEEWD